MHRNAIGEWIQSIPEYSGGQGGYTEAEAQADIAGGYAGASFFLGAGDPAAKLIDIGHLLEWHIHGRPIYAGVCVGKDDKNGGYGISAKGVLRDYLDTASINWLTGTNQKASDVIKSLIGWFPSDHLSTSTAYIDTSSYVVAAAQSFVKQKRVEVVNKYNSFEGWEWGGFIPKLGNSLAEKTHMFYRSPDTATPHYQVDASRLAERPTLQLDRDNFGNYVTVYRTASTPQLYTAGAASLAKHGYRHYDIDIGEDTSVADSDRAAAAFLNGLMVDGVETPPITTEIKLNYGSNMMPVKQSLRDIFSIIPGQNILVTGLGDIARTLTAIDNRCFFHIETVKWSQSGEVTLSVGRGYNPAVLLARLKKAA